MASVLPPATHFFQLSGCHLLKVPQLSQIALTVGSQFQTYVPVRDSATQTPHSCVEMVWIGSNYKMQAEVATA